MKNANGTPLPEIIFRQPKKKHPFQLIKTKTSLQRMRSVVRLPGVLDVP